MASIVSIIPIVLLFILMLGFKMAGHKSALLTLVVTVLLALFAASPLGMIAPEHAEDSVIALTGWAVVEGILKAVFPILIIILMAIVAVVEDKKKEQLKQIEVKKATVQANSKDELLDKIKNIEWNSIKPEDNKIGGRFDFSI